MSRKTICKKEFVKMLAVAQGVTQVEAEGIYYTFTAVLEDALRTGQPVVLGSIGKIQAKVRPAANCYNPQTKEKMYREATPRIGVKVASEFKERMKKWQIF